MLHELLLRKAWFWEGAVPCFGAFQPWTCEPQLIKIKNWYRNYVKSTQNSSMTIAKNAGVEGSLTFEKIMQSSSKLVITPYLEIL